MAKSRPGRSRHVVVRDTLYKIRLHFWRGPEKAMVTFVRKDCADSSVTEHDGAARTLSYVSPGFGQLVVHIWVSPDYPLLAPFGASALSHECVHAANAVFERIGASATTKLNEDEPYAYYVEWLVREYLRRMA